MIRKIPLHWQVVICMVVGALIGIALNPYSDYLKNPDLLKDKDPTEKFYLDEDMLEWKGPEADSFHWFNLCSVDLSLYPECPLDHSTAVFSGFWQKAATPIRLYHNGSSTLS